MRGKEVLERAKEICLGTQVEGTVSAVLPSRINLSSRYIVTTPNQETLDVHIPNFTNYGLLVPVYFPRPRLARGSIISARSRNVKPWVDGQIVNF